MEAVAKRGVARLCWGQHLSPAGPAMGVTASLWHLSLSFSCLDLPSSSGEIRGVIEGSSHLGYREYLVLSSQQTSCFSSSNSDPFSSAASLSSSTSSPTISSKKLCLTDALAFLRKGSGCAGRR